MTIRGGGARTLAVNRLFLTVQDVDDIQNLVLALPPDSNVLDCGAGSGTTALAVYEARPDVHIVTVDINATNIDWARKNLQAYIKDADLPHWSSWQGRVDQIDVSGWLHKDFALVLHDAGHSEEDVYGDIQHLRTIVAPGTKLWVHDFSPMPGVGYEEGVSRAILRLLSDGLIDLDGTPTGLGWIGHFH